MSKTTSNVIKKYDKAEGIIKKGADISDEIPVANKAKTTSGLKSVGESFDVPKLPQNPSDLNKMGWKESTPIEMKTKTQSMTFKKGNVTIRFDKGQSGATGYRGKDHYHILNPNSTGKHDYYLDKYGNPVAKNSKSSHIIP